MSNDQLDGRVARFSELAGNDALFVDTVIPGHARSIWAIIGPNVGEDRDTKVAIPPEGFHLAIVHCDPGNGAALHTHTTVEVFMPLSGRWQLTYGEEGEHDVTLEQWDVTSPTPTRTSSSSSAGRTPAG